METGHTENKYSQNSQRHSLLPLGHYLLVFVVLHQALHVPQLPVQFGLVVVDQVHLAPQTCHVGLEHGLHVGSAHPLDLQQLQFCLKHLILLLQEAHLNDRGGKTRDRKCRQRVFQLLFGRLNV